MTCTFFGHRDTDDKIEEKLIEILEDLIKNRNVTNFYVGNNGHFDFLVRKNLKALKEKFNHIDYAVVLAYMPREKKEFNLDDCSDTIFPDGLESVPPRFAISKRNEWMIENSDLVVTYVKYIVGGAAKFKALSKKKGKRIRK